MPSATGPVGVFPDSQAAQLELAGNEHESFQIVLRPDVNTTYDVDISGSGNSSGAQLEIWWEQVGLMEVPEILNNTQGGAGWWPDPCLRVPRAMGVAGVALSLWVTVHAPPTADPGEHKATVTLTSTHAGTASIVVPVVITVFPFALPTQPALLTAFNLDPARLAKVYNKSSPPVPLSAIETMWEHTGCSNPFSATRGEQPLWESSSDGGASDMYSYCTLTKAGTATPGQRAVCGTVPGACTLQHLPGGGGFDPTARAAHTEHIQWARWMLANFSLNPGTIYSPPIPFTVQELSDMLPLGLNSFTAFPAVADLATESHVKAYVAALDAANLSRLATTYGFDESDELDSMQSTFYTLKQAFPSIKTFTTAHMCGDTHDWRAPVVPCSSKDSTPVQDPAQIKRRNVDYMCPILDWVQPDNMTACEQAGLDMWLYTSLEPHGTYCNLRVDNLLHEPRLLFWQAAQLEVTGFLYYAVNAWHAGPKHTPINGATLASPYIDPSEWNPMQSQGAEDVGDGVLTYAGSDGPLSTIRLHAVRDGIEDFGYLALLREKKGAAAVQAMISKLATPGNLQAHIGGTPAELQLMLAQRRDVAAAISA